MVLFLVILIVGGALVAYTLIEKRINQKPCPACGSPISRESLAEDCPRCRSNEFPRERDQRTSDIRAGGVIKTFLSSWPRLVFIGVPSIIAVVSGGLLLAEHSQSDADKAIRLVKESNSRKENFNVQQYLYATVYHRRAQGEPITITGWRASLLPAEHSLQDLSATVDFVYSDSEGEHVASWEASLREGRVSAKNEAARELSWH